MQFLRQVLIAIALIQSQAPLRAQEGPEIICVLPLRLWNGSPEEVRAIQQVPIPESFRASRNIDCETAIGASFLIDWHGRYGDETTVNAALRFIEQRDGDPVKEGRKLGATVNRMLRQANREFAAAGVENDPKEKQRFMEKSAAVAVLSNFFSGAHFDLLAKTDLYLQPAEIFNSPELLRRARAVFKAYQDVELMIERKSMPAVSGKEIRAYIATRGSHSLSAMEVDLRLAALDARLRHNPSVLEERVSHYQTPAYLQSVRLAFQRGDDFCDLDETSFRNDWQLEVATACEEDDFESRAMAFGYAQAMLRILKGDLRGPHPGWTWEDYERFKLRQGERDTSLTAHFGGGDPRLISLKMVLVDQYLSKGDDTSSKTGDRIQAFFGAWNVLAQLAPAVNPALNPVRFRQLAERADAIASKFGELNRHEATGYAGFHDRQLLSYFRVNNTHLGDMAGAMAK